MRKLVIAWIAALAVGVGLMVVPGMVLAGGPTIPNDPSKPMPPPHRHYVRLTDGTRVEVGPDYCDNQSDPAIKLAFYNFHWNVHKGAAGLSNGTGADITAGPC